MNVFRDCQQPELVVTNYNCNKDALERVLAEKGCEWCHSKDGQEVIRRSSIKNFKFFVVSYGFSEPSTPINCRLLECIVFPDISNDTQEQIERFFKLANDLGTLKLSNLKHLAFGDVNVIYQIPNMQNLLQLVSLTFGNVNAALVFW